MAPSLSVPQSQSQSPFLSPLTTGESLLGFSPSDPFLVVLWAALVKDSPSFFSLPRAKATRKFPRSHSLSTPYSEILLAVIPNLNPAKNQYRRARRDQTCCHENITWLFYPYKGSLLAFQARFVLLDCPQHIFHCFVARVSFVVPSCQLVV